MVARAECSCGFRGRKDLYARFNCSLVPPPLLRYIICGTSPLKNETPNAGKNRAVIFVTRDELIQCGRFNGAWEILLAEFGESRDRMAGNLFRRRSSKQHFHGSGSSVSLAPVNGDVG